MLRTTLLFLLLAASQVAVGQVERDTRGNRQAPETQARRTESFRLDDLFVRPSRATARESGNRDVNGQAPRFGRFSGLDELIHPNIALRYGQVTERSQVESSSSDRPAQSGPDKTLYLRWLADQRLPGSVDQSQNSSSSRTEHSENSPMKYPPDERFSEQPLPDEQAPAGFVSTAIPELIFEPRQMPITGHLTSFAGESVPPRRELAVAADVGGADPFAYFSRDLQQLRPFTPILPAILSSGAVSPRTKSYLAREYETQFWQAVGAGLHARDSQ